MTQDFYSQFYAIPRIVLYILRLEFDVLCPGFFCLACDGDRAIVCLQFQPLMDFGG